MSSHTTIPQLIVQGEHIRARGPRETERGSSQTRSRSGDLCRFCGQKKILSRVQSRVFLPKSEKGDWRLKQEGGGHAG
jgi:hypothetical protein